jgi:hypothetical protein
MLSLSVAKLNDRGKYETIYDCIDTFENAELLSQLAMSNKREDELIIIFPGWHRGIEKKPEVYKKALELAEEYKSKIR